MDIRPTSELPVNQEHNYKILSQDERSVFLFSSWPLRVGSAVKLLAPGVTTPGIVASYENNYAVINKLANPLVQIQSVQFAQPVDKLLQTQQVFNTSCWQAAAFAASLDLIIKTPTHHVAGRLALVLSYTQAETRILFMNDALDKNKFKFNRPSSIWKPGLYTLDLKRFNKHYAIASQRRLTCTLENPASRLNFEYVSLHLY